MTPYPGVTARRPDGWKRRTDLPMFLQPLPSAPRRSKLDGSGLLGRGR